MTEFIAAPEGRPPERLSANPLPEGRPPEGPSATPLPEGRPPEGLSATPLPDGRPPEGPSASRRGALSSPATESPGASKGNVRVLGIRHHGPGSARAVAAALADHDPDVVLIEGPPEADVLVQ